MARLLRPQGRRGELLAEPLTNLEGVFTAGLEVALQDPLGARLTETKLESCWSPTGRNAGRIVLKLAGIDTISAAEALDGWELLAPSAALPQLEPDTWFVGDLIGCELLDGDVSVGRITGIEYPVSPDGNRRLLDVTPLLEVTIAASYYSDTAPADGRQNVALTVLIPFAKAWLESVDIPRKRIVMHLPPGLVDLAQ